MIVVVNPELETPPYAQIEQQIKAAIERGELLESAVLPTVRQLADDLGVAPNTVARAYTDLQDEGWIVGEGRRGTRVAARIPLRDRHARTTALHDAVAAFVESLRHRGYTISEIASACAKLMR
jgi:GntR family transcriptional regulator